MSKRTNKIRRVYRILNRERDIQEYCWNCGRTTDDLKACHSTRSGERPTDDDHPNNWLWYEIAWLCLHPCAMEFNKLNSYVEKEKIRVLRAKEFEYRHPDVESQLISGTQQGKEIK